MEREDLYIEEDLLSEDEFEFKHSGEMDPFDMVVGRLEELVMSDEFTCLKNQFMNSYAHEFTGEEENKLVYMDIFNEYLGTIEQYIESQLADIDMDVFKNTLMERQDEIDGPIFEMLLSFSDFLAFKEMMTEANKGESFAIVGGSSVIHLDEMEDGEERPDLDGLMGMNINAPG